MPVQARPVEERFWEKVSRGSDDECWPWLGKRDEKGYGFVCRGGRCGPKVRVHRFSWELHHGAIPGGLLVCHACDNPGCVNPSHLWLGTPADNMADRDAKGRYRPTYGETNGMASLTENDVHQIRHLASSSDLSQREIARRFGVTQSQISRIISGKRWAHRTVSM